LTALPVPMPRKRESVGRALRLALGEEVVLQRIEARKPGVSQLMNERRLRIFEAVFNNPGIHVRGLQRSLGIPLQSLRWHLTVLLSSRLIEKVGRGNKESLFAPVSSDASTATVLAISRDARFAPLLEVIEKQGEASVGGLVRATGLYQQLVSARIRTLLLAGAIEAVGGGARKRYRIRQAASRRTPIDAEETKRQREALLVMFREQGLVPRVTSQAGGTLAISVDRGIDEIALEFRLQA